MIASTAKSTSIASNTRAPFNSILPSLARPPEGIELSRSWEPDCILLDFNLPDMDGLEVLPRLRGEDGRLPCAVVMLTACGGEELAVNAMKAGAMDYLPKGQVSAEVLPHKVVNAIERFQMLQRIDEQRSALERSAQQYQTLLEAIPQMVWMANAEGRVEYANSQWFEYTGFDPDQPGQFPWHDLLLPEDREPTASAWAEARRDRVGIRDRTPAQKSVGRQLSVAPGTSGPCSRRRRGDHELVWNLYGNREPEAGRGCPSAAGKTAEYRPACGRNCARFQQPPGSGSGWRQLCHGDSTALAQGTEHVAGSDSGR